MPDIEPECWKSNIMAPLVRSASRFLFPCTVEYSLLCAVILGVMWMNACSDDKTNQNSPQTPDCPAERVSGVNIIYSRSIGQFSVDCTSAHKGLFGGILMLVLSIVSLIMFYELVKRPELVEVAVLQVSLPDRTGKCRLSYRVFDQISVFQSLFYSTPILCPARLTLILLM
jgi:large subunit ribosomal protein L18